MLNCPDEELVKTELEMPAEGYKMFQGTKS